MFVAHGQAVPGIAAACRARADYLRKHDPLRMAVEHLTFEEENLRGGFPNQCGRGYGQRRHA